MAIYRGSGGSVESITESDVVTIAISQGGTGAQTASDARANLGLGTAATTDASAYATADQGTTADSAVQPADLATVATSGSYDDLSDKPTIPSTFDSLTDVVITSATTGQGLQFDGTNWVNSSAGSGTVSSVDMSVPTGLAVSGNPVTTVGTLAVTYASGYAIPTTAKQTEWDTAYTDRNKWDGGATGLTAATGRTSLGLGTAATTAATDYATAAQGTKADSALQSSDIGVSLQGYDADTTKNDVANTFTDNQIVSVTDNTNAALRITQLGTGNALLVEDSTNPDATPFVIAADGKVVVGSTTAPTISGVPQFQVAGVSTAASSQVGFSRWDNSASSSAIQFAKSRSGVIGTQGVVSSGDAFGQIQFYGDDGTAFIQGANITAAVDGTPGTNDMPGRLVFSTTADGASSPTEAMRITSAQKVGIGTTAPLTALNVNGTGGELIRISVTPDSGVIQEPALGFATGVTNTYPAAKISCQELDASDSRAGLAFYTRGDNADSEPTQRMLIRHDGGVSIGGIGSGSVALYMQKDITGGATAYSTYTVAEVMSDVTTAAFINRTNIDTAAASFTLPTLMHYGAYQGTIGAGSTVTNQYGFYAASNISGATNNYGFFSNIAAASGDWNFYAQGTARNYFEGGVTIGRTAVTAPADTDGNVFSGTYTPTQVSTNTNVDSVSFFTCQYMRVGNVVTVSGQISVDATAATTSTVVKFSLPIASNLSAGRNLGGTGASSSSGSYGSGASLLSDTVNDCVEMRFVSVSTGSIDYRIQFTYLVV